MNGLTDDIINLDKKLSEQKVSASKKVEALRYDANIYYENLYEQTKEEIEKKREDLLNNLNKELDSIKKQRQKDFLRQKEQLQNNIDPKHIAENIAKSIENLLKRSIKYKE